MAQAVGLVQSQLEEIEGAEQIAGQYHHAGDVEGGHIYVVGHYDDEQEDVHGDAGHAQSERRHGVAVKFLEHRRQDSDLRRLHGDLRADKRP